MPKPNRPAVEPTGTFWGAARTVTGSMHLLDAGGQTRPARLRAVPGPPGREPRAATATSRSAPKDIDAVVLSHAHIDHCGNLPNLVQQGFAGPIYCTPATRALAAVMLGDAAKIQEEDAAYLNRKRDRGEPKVEPLYDGRDVYRTLLPAPGGAVRQAGRRSARGMEATFVDAGHLLGSAMVDLRIDGPGGERRLTFTGDLGRPGLPILRDPDPVPAGRPAHQREHLRRPHPRAGGRDGRAARRGRAAHGGPRRQGDHPGVQPSAARRPSSTSCTSSIAAGQAAGRADLRGQPDGGAGDRGVPRPPRVLRRRDAARCWRRTRTCSASSTSATSRRSTRASR